MLEKSIKKAPLGAYLNIGYRVKDNSDYLLTTTVFAILSCQPRFFSLNPMAKNPIINTNPLIK